MPRILHLLITYTCPLRCDHCFVFGGPRAKGAFTAGQLNEILHQAAGVPGLEWVVFDGGEPFLRYPLLLAGIKKAVGLGFRVGIITNGYFARTEATAENFLRPLLALGISGLYISEDLYHYRPAINSPARRALSAATRLGLHPQRICMQDNSTHKQVLAGLKHGQIPIDTGLKMRGRAAEKLSDGLSPKAWEALDRCPLTDLENPDRLFIDAYGNVQVCQGLTIGNVWDTSLSTVLSTYRHAPHPLLSPLTRGGPALLARELALVHQASYADACHFCYSLRKDLLDIYPASLAPRHVYGLENA